MLSRQVPNYEIQCFYNSYCNALSSLIKANLFFERQYRLFGISYKIFK